MGHYSRVGRPFLLSALIVSATVAIAGGQGHGQRNPRMGGKGANQAKLAQQRAAQQQRAQAQRRAEAQQDRARTGADQPKSKATQDQQRNRTALQQQRPQGIGPNQPPAAQGRPVVDRQEQMRLQIMKQIDLKPEQQQRMVKIRTAHEDEIALTGRTLRLAQRHVDEAIMNPQYNDAETYRRIEDLAQARADQVRLQQRMRAEIRQVLTPEQVMKFNELQREMQRKQQEERQIQMQQTSPDKSPSGNQSRTSDQPALDMIDVFLARGR